VDSKPTIRRLFYGTLHYPDALAGTADERLENIYNKVDEYPGEKPDFAKWHIVNELVNTVSTLILCNETEMF
jgi:hypothetical protein